MAHLEEYIDWLTHGLCRVGRHADDALNRYLIKSFVLQKTRQAGCIVAFCACRVLLWSQLQFMRQRKPYLEHRALLHHAIHADVAAVELHDMLDNREAEPGAAQFPGTALIHAIEPLEDTRQAFLWDAEACILHLNDRHAARSLRGDGNASARAIIFDGILDEVCKDLNDPIWVCSNGELWRELRGKGDLPLLRHGGKVLERLLCDL